MSYDLELFLPEPGLDPVDALRAFLNKEEEHGKALAEKRPWSRDPVRETPNLERNRALAAILQNLTPDLEVAAPLDFSILVARGKISEEEARWFSRTLELTAPNRGIEISFLGHNGYIRVAYWHDSAEAQRVFEEVWSYLGVLHREAGYLTYDPQLESLVDLSSDLPRVLRRYAQGVGQLGKIVQVVERAEGSRLKFLPLVWRIAWVSRLRLVPPGRVWQSLRGWIRRRGRKG